MRWMMYRWWCEGGGDRAWWVIESVFLRSPDKGFWACLGDIPPDIAICSIYFRLYIYLYTVDGDPYFPTYIGFGRIWDTSVLWPRYGPHLESWRSDPWSQTSQSRWWRRHTRQDSVLLCPYSSTHPCSYQPGSLWSDPLELSTHIADMD